MSLDQTAAYTLSAASAKKAQGLPIQWHLTLFGVGILVPVLIVAAIVAVYFASIERTRYQDGALALARDIAIDLDRELDTASSNIQALSFAPILQQGDFAAFDGLARNIAKVRGTEITARDLSGRQLVNTRLPYGTSLPITTDPELRRVDRLAIERGRPVVSDLVVGAVSKLLQIFVVLPVLRDGQPVYLLNLTVTPERILTILKERDIPPGYIAAVFDGGYRLIARSIDQEKNVGTKASPGFEQRATASQGQWAGINRDDVSVSGAYVTTKLANWRVAVIVPTEVLDRPVHRSMLFVAALGVIGVAVSLLLALLTGKRLLRPIQALAAAATALGAGKLVEPVGSGVREIGQVSEVLSAASRNLKRQAHERDVAHELLRQSEQQVRVMAEAALQRSEERFSLLVENVKDYAILMLDPSGLITSWNKGAERIKGYSAAEIVGRHFSQFYLPEDVAKQKPQRQLEAAVAEGRVEDAGWRLRKDGTRFWAEVVITPIYDAGGALTGFGKVTRDVTEQKQYEDALRLKNGELQAAVKELDAFSYSVSHDLRAPLRAIDAFSRIILEEHGATLSPEPREYLQLVRDNTAQMGNLIDDLLALSRLGRQPLTRQTVAAGPMVEQVLAELRREHAGRTVDVSVEKLPSVSADPALLKQVFVNLIGNAFKYTRHRANAVIAIGATDIGGERVFYVRDNGAGFDMKYADQLFKVFQRLHRVEEFEGTGVGLAIVQRVIQRHGGRVWAEAAVDKGATFYFTMETTNHD